MSEEIEFEMGSGNVFADLGRPDAEEMLVKAELVHQIAGIVRHRHLTQVQTAELLGHEDLSTNQMYTRVAIKKLQEVHARTHPARMIL